MGLVEFLSSKHEALSLSPSIAGKKKKQHITGGVEVVECLPGKLRPRVQSPILKKNSGPFTYYTYFFVIPSSGPVIVTYIVLVFFSFSFLAVLEFELRASHLLGRCSTT
jgi:hypothetical protein